MYQSVACNLNHFYIAIRIDWRLRFFCCFHRSM
jgi:hypothetical protein